MKFVTSASVVASAVLPLALAAPQSASYSLLAINSGTPIQARPIQAVDGTFNIGRDASVDCGGDASGACQRYKGTAVVFADGGMGLATSGTSYQRAYVLASGFFGYTAAHSNAVPGGADTVTTFENTPQDSSVDPSYVSITGSSANGFLACPLADNSYQVYANVSNFRLAGDDSSEQSLAKCLGVKIVTRPTDANNAPKAMQY